MGFGAVAAASAPAPPPFACAGEPARASSASETPGEERMMITSQSFLIHEIQYMNTMYLY